MMTLVLDPFAVMMWDGLSPLCDGYGVRVHLYVNRVQLGPPHALEDLLVPVLYVLHLLVDLGLRFASRDWSCGDWFLQDLWRDAA